MTDLSAIAGWVAEVGIKFWFTFGHTEHVPLGAIMTDVLGVALTCSTHWIIPQPSESTAENPATESHIR
jgi:hypothetical protein